LEAERKMGEMLLATERAQGKRNDLVTPRNQVKEPTLSEIGVTKRESSEAQKLASVPRQEFDKLTAGQITLLSPPTRPENVFHNRGSVADHARIYVRSGLVQSPAAFIARHDTDRDVEAHRDFFPADEHGVECFCHARILARLARVERTVRQ
jgi:hypothetical protein